MALFQSCNKDLCEGLCIGSIKGREHIIQYTRPGSIIKQPTPNKEATLCQVNWPVVYPKSSYNIMDPVSSGTPLLK